MNKLIIKHELKQLISSPKAWLGLAIIQFILGLVYNWLLTKYTDQLLTDQSTGNTILGFTEEVIHPFFAWFALIFLFLIPIISMYSICGERQRNTLILYTTSSYSTSSIVIGKFMAYSVMLSSMMLICSLMPLSVIIDGSIDWGHFFTLWLGVWLMLNSALAIGIMISSYGHHPITTTMSIYFVLLTLILIEWGAYFLGPLGLLVKNFGFLYPIKAFLAGAINSHGIAYYLGLICFCLIMSRYRLGRETCLY